MCQLIKQKEKKKIPFRTYNRPKRTFQIQTPVYLCRNKTSKWQKPDKMIKNQNIHSVDMETANPQCNVYKGNMNPVVVHGDLTCPGLGFISRLQLYLNIVGCFPLQLDQRCRSRVCEDRLPVGGGWRLQHLNRQISRPLSPLLFAERPSIWRRLCSDCRGRLGLIESVSPTTLPLHPQSSQGFPPNDSWLPSSHLEDHTSTRPT